MRKLIIAIAAAALTAAAAATGSAHAATTHPATHAAALAQPKGSCTGCWHL